MEDAGTAAGLSQRRRARRYRDGLMIALLAARPLRLANLVQLTLGLELVRRGAGWWLEIPGADTKTGAPVELPWPEELVPALEIYLPSGGRSSPRRGATPAAAPYGSATGTGAQLPAGLQQDRGSHPDRLRPAGQPASVPDAAATTMARDRPAQVRLAAPLLGHRSYTTTERHYNLAQGTRPQPPYTTCSPRSPRGTEGTASVPAADHRRTPQSRT